MANKMTAAVGEPATYPRVNDDPRVVAARDRYTQVQLKLIEVRGKLREIERERGAFETKSASAMSAEAALRGVDTAVLERPQFENEERHLAHQRTVLENAEKLGHKELEAAERTVTGEVLEAARPAYRDIIRAQINLVMVVARAVMEEQHFRDALKEAAGFDIVGRLRPAPICGVGHYDLKEPCSWINYHLKELVESGFITAAERAELIQGGSVKAE